MDYCHQCQRHLNGALACAGCGTPVEELRHLSPSAPAADPVFELDEASEPAGRQAFAPSVPLPGRRAGPAAGAGPVSRRGRKVLFGTVGLALAAGALSLAELADESGGDDGAATAVEGRGQRRDAARSGADGHPDAAGAPPRWRTRRDLVGHRAPGARPRRTAGAPQWQCAPDGGRPRPGPAAAGDAVRLVLSAAESRRAARSRRSPRSRPGRTPVSLLRANPAPTPTPRRDVRPVPAGAALVRVL